MNGISHSMGISASGMAAQGTRIRHVAENIANADTPGYKRKVVSFKPHNKENVSGYVKVGRVRLDQSPLKEAFDPNHPFSDSDGRYKTSNVNTLLEVADAREAQRSYEANLRMFDQARQMASALLGLLKR